MAIDRAKLDQRFKALKSEASSWVPMWQDLSRYIRPTRGFFDGQNPNDGSKMDHKTIVDGTALRAARTLAAGMTSGLTSPSRPWFRLTLPDTDLLRFKPVKEWLAKVEEIMYAVFGKSNIYGVLNSVYEEAGVFSFAGAILLEDFDTVIRGRNFTAGEYYLANGPDGRVNTFARSIYMTAGQMVEEFGEDNVSTEVATAYKNASVDTWFQVCHLIQPNSYRQYGKADNMNMPYLSAHWEQGAPDGKFLRISGYKRFPVVAPRWDTTTTADAYGRGGPGYDSLGDVKQLQEMAKDKLVASKLKIKPPMLVNDSLTRTNFLPGGITRSSSMADNAARPAYQISTNLSEFDMSIADVRNSIRESFYVDMFLMLAQSDDVQRTAREIVERHEEKLLMLGPVIDRMKSELHNPLIDRTFDVGMEAGIFPPPPQELQGMELGVEYISILAQAQKMVGTTAIEQTMGFVGNIVAVAPDALDQVDPDKAVRAYAEMNGADKILRSAEEVDSLRAKKQKALEQQQQAQQAQQMVQGAKVLSDTKVGQNSALDALMNGGGINAGQ